MRGSSPSRPILRNALRFGGSIVEPEVLVTKAIVDAVSHHRHPLYLGVTARCLPGVGNDRTRAVLGQPPFDLPYQLLALSLSDSADCWSTSSSPSGLQ